MKRVIWGSVFAAVSLGYVFAEPGIRYKAYEKLDRRIVNGRAIYKADELVLSPNESIVFEESARVYVNRMSLGKDAKLEALGNRVEILAHDSIESDGGVIDNTVFDVWKDVSGQSGARGEDGVKALDGLKGSRGAHGTHGTDGGMGGDGAPITIIAPELVGNLTLITRGGDGGNGGHGGDGGNGGKGLGGIDARTLYYFKYLDGSSPWELAQLAAMLSIPYAGQALLILKIFNGVKIGDGFDGYDGGQGGDGGNGGNVYLLYGRQVHGTKISIYTQGGRAGIGGRAGRAGIGGEGGEGGKRGDIWAREGKPGKAGLPGQNGVFGKTGKPGKSGRSDLIQSTPAWVACYQTYRFMVDEGEDLDVAREYLKACPRS